MRVYERPPDRGIAVQLCEGPSLGAPRTRVDLEPGRIERGLLRLVLSIVELVRQLMEKQAMRRIEAGSLTPDEADRVGRSLMEIEQTIRALQAQFGIDSLDMDLGPIGRLVQEEP
jgi:Gas vesicle protein K